MEIEYLPTEILGHIFSFLDVRMKVRVAQVCTHWRQAVYAKYLWKNAKIRINLSCSHPDSVIECATRRGIKHIHLEDMQEHQYFQTKNIPDLESLHFIRFKNANSTFLWRSISTELPNLTELNLSFGVPVWDATLERVLPFVKSLKRLSLKDCPFITDKTLSSVALNLKGLNSLDLSLCKISYRGIQYLTNINSQSPLPIKDLSLAHCPHIYHSAVIEISRGLPYLERLNLCGCRIVESSMDQLSKLSCLRGLKVSNVEAVTQYSLSSFVRNKSPLVVLDISSNKNIAKVTIENLALEMPKLRHLIVCNCGISKEEVQQVRFQVEQLEADTVQIWENLFEMDNSTRLQVFQKCIFGIEC